MESLLYLLLLFYILKSLLAKISAFSLLYILLESLLSLYFSFEISTFSLLFYWNLYFLFTFLLKSLLALYFSIEISFYFSIEISTGSYFSMKCLLSLHFSIEPLKPLGSLLSLYFSIETSTFSLVFIGISTHMCASTTFTPALHCKKQSCLASPNVTTHTKISKKSYAQRATQPGAAIAPRPRRTQRLIPLAFATPCTQIHCENTGIRTLPYFQTCTLSHACRTKPPHDWATPWLSYIQLAELPLDYSTCWLRYLIQWWVTSCLLYNLIELFNWELPFEHSTSWLSYSIGSYLLVTLPHDCAIQMVSYVLITPLPLDYSTSWLSYPIVRNYGSF